MGSCLEQVLTKLWNMRKTDSFFMQCKWSWYLYPRLNGVYVHTKTKENKQETGALVTASQWSPRVTVNPRGSRLLSQGDTRLPPGGARDLGQEAHPRPSHPGRGWIGGVLTPHSIQYGVRGEHMHFAPLSACSANKGHYYPLSSEKHKDLVKHYQMLMYYSLSGAQMFALAKTTPCFHQRLRVQVEIGL